MAKRDDDALWLGIDVGGSKTAVGVVDGSGRLLAWEAAPTPVANQALPIAEAIAAAAAALLERLQLPAARLTAGGVGFPGDIDPEDGRVFSAPNVPAFIGQMPAKVFATALQEALHVPLPVVVENDACAAARAEALRGAGCGASRLLYLTVSSGVGGARFEDGEARNLEPGLRLFPDPTQPTLCLEDLAGGVALARRARAAIAQGATASPYLAEVPKEALSTRHLATAAAQGDPFSQQLLDAAARHVAAALALLLGAGDGGERVVIGGSVALKTAGYLTTVREELRALQARQDAPLGLQRFDVQRQLLPAALGDERGVIGAALLAGAPQ